MEIPASAFGTAWREYRSLANLGTVFFIAFQLAGGVLGDIFGRRRVLLIGAVGATAGNLLTLAAWNIPSLVIARGLTGLFGALAFPLTLALVRLSFADEERKLALLIFTFVSALGSLASLLGMPIEDWFGWRWTLALPIATGLLGITLARRAIPESRVRGGSRRGEAVVAAAWTMVLVALIFGLTTARTSGAWFNPITITAGIVGSLGLLVMIFWLRRSSNAQMHRTARHVSRLHLAVLLFISALLNFALGAYVLQLYQFFANVQERSGIVSGLALAPILLFNLFSVGWATRFISTSSRRIVVGGGLAAMGLAMLLSALARPSIPYLLLVPPMALFGHGFLLASAAWTFYFFNALPVDLTGMSAGINRAAGLIGMALAGLILSSVLQIAGKSDFLFRLAAFDLDAEQQQQALLALDQALQQPLALYAQAQAPEDLRTLGLLAIYRESYSVGISAALVTGGSITLAGGVIAWLWFSRAGREPDRPLEDRPRQHQRPKPDP